MEGSPLQQVQRALGREVGAHRSYGSMPALHHPHLCSQPPPPPLPGNHALTLIHPGQGEELLI